MASNTYEYKYGSTKTASALMQAVSSFLIPYHVYIRAVHGVKALGLDRIEIPAC